MKNVFNAIQIGIFIAIRKRKLIKNNVIDFVEGCQALRLFGVLV